MKTKCLLFLILGFSFTACSDGKEGLKEQTGIQTQEQINASNKNLEIWAEKLKVDLDKRRSFINAIAGEFEGGFVLYETEFKVRLLLAPTIPDYEIDRTRTLAELEYELQNLNLNIQIIQWNPESKFSVGCVIEDIKPDPKKGLLNLISETCPNTYQLYLSDEPNVRVNIKDEDLLNKSVKLASQVESGDVKYIQSLVGKLRSSNNAQVHSFSIHRVQ